ncbi:MAG: hypothetical protein QM740_20255 [Acidovorax sp.]
MLNLFESQLGYLAKIARTSHHGPLHEWVWLAHHHALTLQLLDDEGDCLGFAEGWLRRDDSKAEFHWSDGRIAVLRALAPDDLPPPVRGFLELHLS